MSKLRVSSFAVSIDGFGAGPNQVGYESVKHVAGVRATHVSLRRRA